MNDPRIEIPACAAVRYLNGVIITGKRHSDCLYSTILCGLNSFVDAIVGKRLTYARLIAKVPA